jgi:hypothetical protein
MKTTMLFSILLFVTFICNSQGTMRQRTLNLHIPSEKKEIQVRVSPDINNDYSVYNGSYMNISNGATFTLTIRFQNNVLTVRYESKGGASDASFDYFNPYIENGILYCEKNEFEFVTLNYFSDGVEKSVLGLLESEKFFFEKQP